PLVAVDAHEGRALPTPVRRRPGARVVAAPRPLHLHDLGAHVAEDLGAVGAGDVLGEIGDKETSEGRVHGDELYRYRPVVAPRGPASGWQLSCYHRPARSGLEDTQVERPIRVQDRASSAKGCLAQNRLAGGPDTRRPPPGDLPCLRSVR